MLNRFTGSLASAAALTLLTSTAQAFGGGGIAPYSEDFESLDAANPTALGDAGWLIFGNVFNNDFTAYLYGYGVFPAPNDGGGFCVVGTGQGGPDQGAQQLVTFSDYNNTDHGNSNQIEANVFQEQIVGAGDVGKTFVFTFDAKRGDTAAPSAANAFIKIIDGTSFGLDGLSQMATQDLPTTWDTYSLSIEITPDHVGDFFQIGFNTIATDYNPSGMVYDNLSLEEDTGGGDDGIAAYSEDFESLDAANTAALADAGWLVFANVFNNDFTAYLYGYGVFPAPNDGGGFCVVGTGQGGPDQGAQQLVTFSDYNNTDHGNSNQIEANVFQEQIVGAGDVGKTFVFTFDAKRGDTVPPSAANAFIKIIDGTSFGLDGLSQMATQDLPTTWGTYSLSIEITSNHVGDFFQIGFNTIATDYNPSGMVYDNLSLEEFTGLGTNYCTSSANSSGGAATISASGSVSIAANDLVLTAGPAPEGENGLFYYGANQISAAFGNGTRCVGGASLARLPIGTITGGELVTAVDNTLPPYLAVTLTAGSTWNFQAWFRDSAAGTGNFDLSDGLELTFQP